MPSGSLGMDMQVQYVSKVKSFMFVLMTMEGQFKTITSVSTLHRAACMSSLESRPSMATGELKS